jgi:hypothetical protein
VRRFQSVCATALALGLLAGTSAAVSAQSAPPSELSTYVTGIRVGSEDVQWADPVIDAAGVTHFQGNRIVQTIEWSDPRLPSTMILDGNTDVYGDVATLTGSAVFTGTILLQDDEGSWTGTQVGYWPPDAMLMTMVTLEGQGAYDGLSAILSQSYADAQAQQDDVPSWKGVIVEGALPPYPDAVPEPVTE